MIIYSVIGFPYGGGWATFHKEYKRRKNAEKQQRKLAISGNYKSVMLRKENILVDKGDECYISIDGPLYSLERDASGKITRKDYERRIIQ